MHCIHPVACCKFISISHEKFVIMKIIIHDCNNKTKQQKYGANKNTKEKVTRYKIHEQLLIYLIFVCISVLQYLLVYLYVIIMSRMCFKVNLHSLVAWMSWNSLLESCCCHFTLLVFMKYWYVICPNYNFWKNFKCSTLCLCFLNMSIR